MDGRTSTVGHLLLKSLLARSIKWICKYWIQQLLAHMQI